MAQMAVDPQTKPTDPRPGIRWIPLSEITEPGTYVAKDTGDLIRVPAIGASEGDEDLFDKHTNKNVSVVRVSPDPFIPITKARFAAASMDIEVSF
jgi:hypothetical protein